MTLIIQLQHRKVYWIWQAYKFISPWESVDIKIRLARSDKYSAIADRNYVSQHQKLSLFLILLNFASEQNSFMVLLYRNKISHGNMWSLWLEPLLISTCRPTYCMHDMQVGKKNQIVVRINEGINKFIYIDCTYNQPNTNPKCLNNV